MAGLLVYKILGAVQKHAGCSDMPRYKPLHGTQVMRGRALACIANKTYPSKSGCLLR